MFIYEYKSQKASIFVEAAISLPVVLVLLFGIIEYGNISTKRAILSDIVRTTARWMAAQGDGIIEDQSRGPGERDLYKDAIRGNIEDELLKHNLKLEMVHVQSELVTQQVDAIDKPYLNITTRLDVPCLTCSKLIGLNTKLFTISSNSRVLLELSN